MSFNWSMFFRYVEEFAPMVIAAIPGIPPPLVPYISMGIKAAETIPGASGANKLTAATTIATAAIQAAAAVGAPLNPTVEVSALQNGISAVVQAVNGIVKSPVMTPAIGTK